MRRETISKMKTAKKEAKGITLIALVITIIVLLILAAVSIATLTGENGILSQAGNAQIATRASEVEERVNLWKSEKEASNYTDTTVKEDNELLEEMKDAGILFEEEINRETKTITIGDKVINYGTGDSLTDIYVALYNDGTLVFNNKNEFDESKIIENGNFGNIKDEHYEWVDTYEEPYVDIEKVSPWVKLMIEGVNINTVEFMNEIIPKEVGCWFTGLELTEIKNIQNLNTSRVTNMSKMFAYSSITNVNLSGLDFSNVTDVSEMFAYSSITNVNLSGLDFSNVTDMGDMFNNSNAETVDLSNIDTSNVVYMGSMFYACSNLKNVNLTGIDTSNVVSMTNMFAYCEKLTNLDLIQFNTNNVKDMSSMFLNCRGLESINVSNFDTSNVEDMKNMFDGCTSLTSLDVSDFNVSKMTNNPDGVTNMFRSLTMPITINNAWTDEMKTETGYKGEFQYE